MDLVVESGALGVMLPAAFGRVLDCCGDGPRPWFLYCPRPDVNWTALDALWAECGYRTESFLGAPVRYRKPLDAQERADMLRRSRGFGKPDEAIMQGGYFLVDMTLGAARGRCREPAHRRDAEALRLRAFSLSQSPHHGAVHGARSVRQDRVMQRDRMQAAADSAPQCITGITACAGTAWPSGIQIIPAESHFIPPESHLMPLNPGESRRIPVNPGRNAFLLVPDT